VAISEYIGCTWQSRVQARLDRCDQDPDRDRLRRVSPVEAALLLLGAGIVAGVVGSGGGVSSLVSYPALLGVGIPPLAANIANLVAGVAIAPGAALSSRRELTDARPALIRLLPVAVAGTVLGAGLLLLTPPRLFAHVVPFLVVAGSVVLIIQPALLKLRGRADVEVVWPLRRFS
jgi:uncharacterized protein